MPTPPKAVLRHIEHLYHAFMYSPVSLLSSIYPLPAIHLVLVTSDARNMLIMPYHGNNRVSHVFSLMVLMR